jgi:carbamoyltransferase
MSSKLSSRVDGPRHRIGIALSTKERIQLTGRILPGLDCGGFDLIWCDGSKTPEGRAFARADHFSKTPLVEIHPDVTGGPDAAIQFALKRLLALGYDYVGLIENDIQLKPGWLTELTSAWQAAEKDGFKVGAASARSMISRVLAHGPQYVVQWNVGAGMVLFSRAAAEAVLKDYRLTSAREIRTFFLQAAGVELSTVWELFMDRDDRPLGADWHYASSVWKTGCISIGNVPTFAENIDYDIRINCRTDYVHAAEKSWPDHCLAIGQLKKAMADAQKNPSPYAVKNPSPLENAQRILFVRTDSIGDLVLASAMLEPIKKKYPQAKLTVLCQQHVAELFVACPFVDSIICYEVAKLAQQAGCDEIVAEITAYNPDVILNSTRSRDRLSDELTLKFGAARHIAIESDLENITPADRQLNLSRYQMLIPTGGAPMTELARYAGFLHGLGISAEELKPVVWTSPQDEALAEAYFQQQKLDPARTIAVFPGAQRDIRVYHGYADALQALAGYKFLIFGVVGENPLAQALENRLPGRTINLCGRSKLRETAALLRRCRLYVGADSSGAHLACALGVPNVVVLGGGHFGRFLPYSPLTSAVVLPLECFGCGWRCRQQRAHCIKDLSPAVLAEAIQQTLDRVSTQPRLFLQSKKSWSQAGGSFPRWQFPVPFVPVETSIVEKQVTPAAAPRPTHPMAARQPDSMKSTKHILSIAFCMHDSCVTIADDTRILVHLEGERYFKQKHIRVETPEKMDQLVGGALQHVKLSINDISEVLLAGYCNRYPLPQARILGKAFIPILTGHHENHLGTAFPSGFDDAVIVCADGGSDEGPGTPYLTSRIYLKKGSQITLLEDLDDSSMNGRFYGTAAQMVIHPDFETAHNTGVGKLMGLSSMGRYDQEIWDLITRHERLFNVHYTKGCQSLLDLFGLGHDYNQPWQNERRVNFAYCAHNFWVERFYEHLKKFTHLSSNIALTGGCALNISLNSRLIDSGLYRNVYVSPISSDCGQSIGAVLYRYPGTICDYPYLGRGFNPPGVADSQIKCDFQQLVADLMSGKIVAWYQGRSEIGPRALGHRSFLGLPNSTEMRDKLSIKVKRREPYRPVAAIILDEDEHEFFESKGDFRYMTFVAKAKEITKKLAPAIVHYDGTTRLQTLGQADNPLLYECLKELKKKTGVPIIMNSSFNVAGNPIVDSPEDAMVNFMASEAEVLYLNGLRIENPRCASPRQPDPKSQPGLVRPLPRRETALAAKGA